VDLNLVERLTDGIFSKALQVRRMIQRRSIARSAGACSCPAGGNDLMCLALAEIVALSERLEGMLNPEQLILGDAQVAAQRWHKPTIEMNVTDGYAEWSKQYDSEVPINPLIALEEPVVLELIGDVAGLDVLDAACGTGRYALKLAEAGARVCGVDASEEMLAYARGNATKRSIVLDLRAGNLCALPFADESFDLVVCALALCHVPEPTPAMREFARVLRPGGRVVISDFHPYCLLIGWRTCFDRPEARYWIENHLNLTQDYIRALLANGLVLTDLRESVVDERVVGILSEHDIERFRGWPAALVLAAQKESDR
jgi:SAM-dependent methyltransferase